MSSLYISNPPSLSSLEGYLAELSCGYQEFGLAQVLKAKCRELARSNSSLLVAPTPASQHVRFGSRVRVKATVWIVANPIALATPGKVQDKLKELDFKLVEKVKVTPSVLQTCFSFTTIARLAPKWNMINTWLVQGSDFLSTSKASAIDFEVNFSSTDIALTVNVQKLFFKYLKVENLGLTPRITKKFSEDPGYVISEKNITCNRCLVLPNLSPAYVYSASHGMPHSLDQTFSNYDQLRLHWKKQHGIMLPEVQQLFYQVFFGMKTRRLFSYPACCVLQSAPLVYPDRDTHITASLFVHDLHSRMPTICGSKIVFSPQVLNTVSTLNPASSSELGGHANTVPASQPVRQVVNVLASQPVRQATVPASQPVRQVTNVSTSQPVIQANTIPASQPMGQATTVPDTQPKRPANSIPASQPAIQANTISASQPVRPTDTIPVSQPPISSQQQSRKVFPVPSVDSRSPLNRITPCFKSLQENSVANEKRALGPGEQDQQIPTPKKPCFDSTNIPDRALTGTTSQAATPTSAETVRSAQSDNLMKMIGRCKVADLRKWLQEKGVRNHSKKKKEELVNMVTLYIAKTGCAYP